MVERLLRFGHGAGQLVEVEDVAGVGARRAVDGDAGAERMAVHARVRRPGRGARQEVGGFELELFVDAHGGL